MSVHNETADLVTSTYDNFIQTTDIRDGALHYAKILSVFYDNLDTSDPNDPEVIIKIDISNVFNTTCRTLTLDVLSGRASHDYACGLVKGHAIPNCETLNKFFGYFKKSKTGGQQGDPLEMLIFNLTIHNLWVRVLVKYPQARSLAYADDGYIKPRMRVALQVLSELKYVLKENAGLDLNVSKTSVLPKGVMQ
jgi:hypothetical protein